MNYKIVSDSSANILSLEDPHFVSVPMKVRAEKEYLDDMKLDLAGMVADLKKHNGPSGSSCPSVGEWLDAFGDAVLAQFPDARIRLEPTTALCSFYAEAGGLMIGFEGGFNSENDNRKF